MTHQIKSCVCVERRGHSRGGKRANKSSVVEIWPRKDIRSSCKTRVSSPACSFKWNGQLKTQQSPPVGRREHKHTQEKIGRTFSSENPTGCKPESIIAQSQPHALHSRPSYTHWAESIHLSGEVLGEASAIQEMVSNLPIVPRSCGVDLESAPSETE